jgi:hypothetical protein
MDNFVRNGGDRPDSRKAVGDIKLNLVHANDVNRHGWIVGRASGSPNVGFPVDAAISHFVDP